MMLNVERLDLDGISNFQQSAFLSSSLLLVLLYRIPLNSPSTGGGAWNLTRGRDYYLVAWVDHDQR